MIILEMIRRRAGQRSVRSLRCVYKRWEEMKYDGFFFQKEKRKPHSNSNCIRSLVTFGYGLCWGDAVMIFDKKDHLSQVLFRRIPIAGKRMLSSAVCRLLRDSGPTWLLSFVIRSHISFSVRLGSNTLTSSNDLFLSSNSASSL